MRDRSQRVWEERLAGLGRVAVASCALVLVTAIAGAFFGAVGGAVVIGPLALGGAGAGAVMLRGGRRAAVAALAFGLTLAWLASADPVTRIDVSLLLPFNSGVFGIPCIVAGALYCGVGGAFLVAARRAEPSVVTYRHQRATDEPQTRPSQDFIAFIVFVIVCAISLFGRCPRIR